MRVSDDDGKVQDIATFTPIDSRQTPISSPRTNVSGATTEAASGAVRVAIIVLDDSRVRRQARIEHPGHFHAFADEARQLGGLRAHQPEGLLDRRQRAWHRR